MKSKHAGANDEVIRAGYEANRRVSEIAAELGVTRNVVIGRARRLGLANPERRVRAIAAGYGKAEQSKKMRAWHQAHPGHIEAMQRWWDEHPEAREARRARMKQASAATRHAA